VHSKTSCFQSVCMMCKLNDFECHDIDKSRIQQNYWVYILNKNGWYGWYETGKSLYLCRNEKYILFFDFLTQLENWFKINFQIQLLPEWINKNKTGMNIEKIGWEIRKVILLVFIALFTYIAVPMLTWSIRH
jgi:hypothetical protein